MLSICQRLFLTFSLLLMLGLGSAQAGPLSNPLDEFFITDGQVKAMIQAGGVVYIGGTFTQVRHYTGHGVALAVATGLEDPAFPRVNGEVFAVVPDGSGGWYIGGNFSNVGGVDRQNLAHIKDDKTLDLNWAASTSSEVRAMVKSGNTLYIGGDFNWVNTPQQLRNRVAALDATTGALLAFNPNCIDTVRAMALSGDGSTLYVGGEFHLQADPQAPTCGGQPRNYIAALDVTVNTNNATSWDPNADNAVRALAVSGSSVYVGGDFQNIGTQARSRIAKLNAATGIATNWDPSAQNGGVFTIAVSPNGNTVYAGGGFTKIGFVTDPLTQPTRNRIAALNATDNGTATSWNPNASSSVRSIVLAVSGNTVTTVYAGGSFNATPNQPISIGGQSRNNIAALNPSDGTATATAWNPNLNGPPSNNPNESNGTVHVVALAGSVVYAGGLFDSAGGVFARRNLAAFDGATAAVKSFTADTDPAGTVRALAALGGIIYVGGDFTTIGGLPRNHIAALDAVTGVPTSWNPNAEGGNVQALAISNDPTAPVVYAGGDFTTIVGVSRPHLALLSTSTPVSTTLWNPAPNGAVTVLTPAPASQNNRLFASGAFTTIGGLPRNGLALLNGTTTNPNPAPVIPWDPKPNGAVKTMIVGGPIGGNTICTAGNDPNSTLFLGGDFTCFDSNAATPCSSGGGFARSHIAATRTSGSGTICDWNPQADGTVNALAMSGNSMIVGGNFTVIGGALRNFLAAIDATSGGAAAWNPKPNAPVLALALFDAVGKAYAGGDFATIAGTAPIGLPRNSFAAFPYATLVSSVLPSSRSVQVNTTATAFASIINQGPITATNVEMRSNNEGLIPPSGFSYQATSTCGPPPNFPCVPTNVPVNTPVNINAGWIQNYIFGLTPTVVFNSLDFPLAYEGTNTTAAPNQIGISTMKFVSSAGPVPDVIVVSATCPNIGTLHLKPRTPPPGENPPYTFEGAFASASTNVGIGATVTVKPRLGNSSLPQVALAVCKTNPANGLCTQPAIPAAQFDTAIGAGEQPTFTTFVLSSGVIPTDTTNNRVYIEILDPPGNSGSTVRGSSSVALTTATPPPCP